MMENETNGNVTWVSSSWPSRVGWMLISYSLYDQLHCKISICLWSDNRKSVAFDCVFPSARRIQIRLSSPLLPSESKTCYVLTDVHASSNLHFKCLDSIKYHNWKPCSPQSGSQSHWGLWVESRQGSRRCFSSWDGWSFQSNRLCPIPSEEL